MHDPFNVKSQSDSLYNPVINGKTSNAVIIVFNFYIKKKRQSLLYILLLSTKIPVNSFFLNFYLKNLFFFCRIDCSTTKCDLKIHTLRARHRRIINIGNTRFLLQGKHQISKINMQYLTCPGRTLSDRMFTFSSMLSLSAVG
jgi:hypothetical protein